MNCKELIDFLTEYDQGTLAMHKRLMFDLHLKLCPPCKKFLDDYRAAIKMGKKCCCPKQEPALAYVPEEFIQAVLKAKAAMPLPQEKAKE
jgi:hypothetical protein